MPRPGDIRADFDEDARSYRVLLFKRNNLATLFTRN